MALVDCNVRRNLVASKYNAPPKLVRDESPPNTTFDPASFLNGGIDLGVNAFSRRASKGDKYGFILSQSPSSVFARDNPNPNQQGEIDANLFNLLNLGEANVHDQKITDFTDSLCASFNNNSVSMKITDNSEFEVDGFLSDIRSISIQECDPSVRKGYGRSRSPVLTMCLNDINIPESQKVDKNENASEDSSGKKCIASSESDFNLSDMLSSIYIDDDQPNSKSSYESSLQSGDRSLCLDDFNVIGEISKQQLTELSVSEDIDIAPNCLSFDFCDAKLYEAALQRSLPDSEILVNDIKGSRNHLKSEDSGIGSSIETSDKQESLNGIYIQDFIEDINFRNSNNLSASLDSNKSTGFSFFCDTSENQLTFSQMVDYDRNIDIAQQSNSSCDQDSISMLDLYNSLQSSKESTSASDSNSFTSDEIEKERNSTSLSSPDDDDDQEMVAIDLSTCIKSFEDKSSFNPILQVTNINVANPKLQSTPEYICCDTLQVTNIDVANPKLQSTPEHICHDTRILSLPSRIAVSSQVPRMNLKQSLFAKALSCKSKHDLTLVHKVANIKAELFTKVFGHSTAVKCKGYNPQIEVANYSDKPITQCNYRRVFGQIESGVSPVR